MLKNIFLFLTLLLCLGSSSAQTFIGKLNPFPETQSSVAADDTIKILAVMVSFLDDRDAATFGTGKFGSIYSQDYGSTIIDPLPHDKNYFLNHLLFVKNYYSKISGGQTVIDYTVLGDTFSVSKTMRNYSPDPNSDNFAPIGEFSKEVWHLADSLNPGFDFSAYDIFLIFHAGVGRDISLPGSIGNERDLPSLYLSSNALKDIYGESFVGFPVSGGAYHITNSMIIPETESREIETITGKFLFEISINGLIAASVASHLGLPDLFDTNTGLSAIGRFGLMDGQSIFAYNGLFPPEPSAWEKIFLSEKLNWNIPVAELTPGNYDIILVTKIAAGLNDTTILKVPLNSSEYYLLENRNRDARSDGSTVTYVSQGNTITRTFLKDTTGFYSFDIDSLEGVVVDVDEFDWAVPGNGIIIWHIDENVIEEKIAENKVNTDKNKRGVDVEEADGVQDIGERFFTIFGDEVIGEGEPEDLWYASNSSFLFKNRFDKSSNPNTKSNSGANSLISISGFSNIGNRMSFKVAYGDSIIKPVFSIEVPTTSKKNNLSSYQSGSTKGFLLKTDSTLLIIDEQGNISSEQFSFISELKPASITYAGITFQPVDSILRMLVNGVDIDRFKILSSGKITCDPIIPNYDASSSNFPFIVFGSENGEVQVYFFGDLGFPPEKYYTIEGEENYYIHKIAANDTIFSFISLPDPDVIFIDGPVYIFQDNSGNRIQFSNEKPIDLAMTKDKQGDYISVVLTNQNTFYVIKGSSIIHSFRVSAVENINSFILTDLKRNGENYIVFANGNKIEARNLSGSLADNFPFEDPLNIGFEGTPLSADFDNDNNAEIIAFTKDGRIFAFDGGTGNVINGFPLSTGAELISTPVLYRDGDKISIAALDARNNFTAWNISPAAGTLYWSEKNGNSYNSAFVDAAESQNFVNTFFPKEKAYNYPNPVYENETQIRYYVSEDSKINIKIFDLAGDFVAELNDDARGGFDNETTWNVSGIQSGVYLARIEASPVSGKSESNIIKIAVVK
ncbi:MAG: T9SS type A sorting domain-containing protein [Ignavibacteriales bacterium]|nr:MAG: T9SS type A sorting domain-containing protein [Ignavibacteriales bacterium]